MDGAKKYLVGILAGMGLTLCGTQFDIPTSDFVKGVFTGFGLVVMLVSLFIGCKEAANAKKSQSSESDNK